MSCKKNGNYKKCPERVIREANTDRITVELIITERIFCIESKINLNYVGKQK